MTTGVGAGWASVLAAAEPALATATARPVAAGEACEPRKLGVDCAKAPPASNRDRAERARSRRMAACWPPGVKTWLTVFLQRLHQGLGRVRGANLALVDEEH